MKYIQKTLLENEAIFFSTRKHWIIFFLPLFFTILSLFFLAQKDLLILLGYLFSILTIYFWFSAVTTYLTSEYAVTNKRVLIKTGFIHRDSWETLLPKVATLEVKQNIIGRIFGYGTLVVQSTGGGKDYFTTINGPLLFRRKVQEQTEKMQVNLPIQGSKVEENSSISSAVEPIIPEPKDKNEQ